MRAYFHSMPPERRALKNEYARIRWNARARAAGLPQRPRRHTVVDRRERVYVDPAPLVAELRVATDGFTDGVGKIAARSGVSERTILRWRDGGRAQIGSADKVAVAIGIPSAVIWGERW